MPGYFLKYRRIFRESKKELEIAMRWNNRQVFRMRREEQRKNDCYLNIKY